LFGSQPYFNKYYRPLSDLSLPLLDYESLNLGIIFGDLCIMILLLNTHE
jgi:hypothetical protein